MPQKKNNTILTSESLVPFYPLVLSCLTGLLINFASDLSSHSAVCDFCPENQPPPRKSPIIFSWPQTRGDDWWYTWTVPYTGAAESQHYTWYSWWQQRLMVLSDRRLEHVGGIKGSDRLQFVRVNVESSSLEFDMFVAFPYIYCSIRYDSIFQ